MKSSFKTDTHAVICLKIDKSNESRLSRLPNNGKRPDLSEALKSCIGTTGIIYELEPNRFFAMLKFTSEPRAILSARLFRNAFQQKTPPGNGNTISIGITLSTSENRSGSRLAAIANRMAAKAHSMGGSRIVVSDNQEQYT